MCVIVCETDDSTSTGFHANTEVLNDTVSDLPTASKQYLFRNVMIIANIMQKKKQ